MHKVHQIQRTICSRIEQGHYSVGLDILSKIASALGAIVDIVEKEETDGKTQ